MWFISGWCGSWLRTLLWINWRIPLEKMNREKRFRNQCWMSAFTATLYDTHQHWAWSHDQTEPIERAREKRRSSKLIQSEVCDSLMSLQFLLNTQHTHTHTHICCPRQNEPINTSFSACMHGCLRPLGLLLTILNKQIRRSCGRGSSYGKGRAK